MPCTRETPGALDNAPGTVVLLLVAEMLAGFRGKYCVEILAINDERKTEFKAIVEGFFKMYEGREESERWPYRYEL